MDKYQRIWDGIFRREITKIYSISCIITCMNRLHNLKETLPMNIEKNISYPKIEFVLIDYNSQDGLEEWVKKNMMKHIESGVLSYYRTNEPKYFSMSHSRNIGFKVAKGEVVNNLDADNFTYSEKETPECFASYLNKIANEECERIIFAKGRRSIHGRVGFYKKDFIDILGGYDENLLGYGHDEHDLLQRAWSLGFTMYWWGGVYCSRFKTSGDEKNKNLERHWKITEKENKEKSKNNILSGRFKANDGKHWGKANLIRNFSEFISI